MLSKRIIEFLVGLFMLAGIASVFLLALKVSGLNQYSNGDTFNITAVFDTIGGLKVRSPVTISGVRIGEVGDISLNQKTFKAQVILEISKDQSNLPVDTVAKILTAGIIGANYIELVPGYAEQNFKDGDILTETQPAIILENLIGQFMYKLKDEKPKDDKKE